MSSTEEIIAAPSANGLGKSPAIENSSSPADKAEIKSTAMTDGEVSELKNAEEKHGEAKPALENHESPSADVEMKEAKEKTPEPDNQNLDKKPSSSDKPPTDEKKTPSSEKPKTDDDKQKPKDEKSPVFDKADEIKDTSGEEKIECVIIAPLTTKEKESGAEGEKEEEEEETEEAGEEEAEKEHEQEQQEKGTSPRKRARRAPFSPRKRSQKKSAPKKKADEKSPKETEKTTKQVEKSPEKTTKDEEKDSSASAVAEKSPKKSNESPRKRQKTPTAEQEDDDTTSDTSPKSSKGTPLLEAPLIIEGKRHRQRVERLDTQMLTPTQKTVDVPQGKGLKLGEISFIDAMISKTPTNDLKGLHRFFFGRPGTPNEIRKNVKTFCGFSDEKEIERKKKMLDTSFVTNDLKKICEVLGLEVGGRKEDLIERAMKFLIEPKDLGKKTPAPKRKRSTATSSRKRSRPSATRGKGASSSKKSETDEGSANEEEEEEEEDAAEEEAEPEMDDKKEAVANEEEENEPKAKKTKRGEKATTSSAAATATPSKRGQPKRAAKNAKKPSYPSDAEIKTTIKELLKGMNLEEVTMKEMTKKVYDKYPQVDISSKKDFIKETVKTLLSATD